MISLPIGGLPLAYILCSSEKTDLLVDAFSDLKDILPKYAFKGRGSLGPKLFVTDDCESEQQALKQVWPSSIHLLCIFHILQALWRWIWSANHKVHKSDRPKIFLCFRRILYSKSRKEYDEQVEILLNDEACQKYQNYISHLKKHYFPRSGLWAMYFRIESNLPTHNMNTNNVAEAWFNPFTTKGG